MKLPAILTMQAMKLPALPPLPPPPPSPQDQMIPMSMALVYFLTLPLAFLYFFAFNTFSKNKKPVNEKQDQPPKRRHIL